MSVFRYRAVAVAGPARGTVSVGELSAETAPEIRVRLRQAGLQVLELRPIRAWRAPAWIPMRALVEAHLRERRRARTDEILDGLSTLLESGVPLVEAFETLLQSDSARGIGARRMLLTLRDEIKGGGSLGKAMRAHGAWFDPVEVALVEAGEHGGTLPATLRVISERHERSSELKHRVAAALAYPSIVAAVGLGVWLFLSTKTLPEFVRILEDARVEVPAITRRVMALGQFLLLRGPLLLLGVVIAAIATTLALRWLGRKRPEALAWLRRATPALARRIALARVARTLSELLENGVPLVEALRVLAPTVRQRPLRDSLTESAARIERGESFSQTLRDERFYPAEFRRLVEMGEASGELSVLLQRLGTRFERNARRRLDQLTTILEPAVILTLAALIGLVVTAAVLPIVRLQEIV